ncbi:hypothetical protein C1645_879056 [Glomus cerebriforme]|uniref:Uncharacterized protein n=1 Tax=Glomus cerebriforme TaxID=658196 RepID=A0A397ST18_9GLOM|nr:hypothetical protein C1645_879056 [Glomus cerebriforme]
MSLNNEIKVESEFNKLNISDNSVIINHENCYKPNIRKPWSKILSQLLEYMESSDNEFTGLLSDLVNSGLLKTIEYCNLNAKALEFILSRIKKEEAIIFSTLEYDLLHYIILWAANEISEEALLFYNSCLPSSKIVRKRIHPFVISNTIESLEGLINMKTIMNVYKKQALLVGKYAYLDDESFQWDDHAHGSKMWFDKSPFIIVSNSSSHEWIRTKVPISGQGLFEWNIVVEKICEYFWVGICTENGFKVNYNSWLGKQTYGWVFGSLGVICHNTQEENGLTQINMDVTFHNLPNLVYPAVSLNSPGRARIEPC